MVLSIACKRHFWIVMQMLFFSKYRRMENGFDQDFYRKLTTSIS